MRSQEKAKAALADSREGVRAILAKLPPGRAATDKMAENIGQEAARAARKT